MQILFKGRVSMTPEIALYIFGAALLPLLGWGMHLTWLIRDIAKDSQKIREYLESPEDHGLGTKATNESVAESQREMLACVNANTQAIKSLTHYIVWLGEQQTGQSAPPPVHTTD
jgi:hypothetical protein